MPDVKKTKTRSDEEQEIRAKRRRPERADRCLTVTRLVSPSRSALP